jgi:hypothetical protein
VARQVYWPPDGFINGQVVYWWPGRGLQVARRVFWRSSGFSSGQAGFSSDQTGLLAADESTSGQVGYWRSREGLSGGFTGDQEGLLEIRRVYCSQTGFY